MEECTESEVSLLCSTSQDLDLSVYVDHWSVILENKRVQLVSILEPPAGVCILSSDAVGLGD